MALHMRPHVTPQDAPCGAVVRGVNLSQRWKTWSALR